MAQVGTTLHGRTAARGGALDLLRFLASLFIVIYHYGAEAPVELMTVHPAFTRGYLATDFFLILSGYVLAINYGDRLLAGETTWREFFWRRFRRVWPGHVMVLFAFLVIFVLATAIGHPPARPMDFQPLDFLAQLFLVQSWGLHVGAGWNFPTWTLSALLFCYAGFAVAWRGVSRLSGVGAVALGMLVVLGFDLCLTSTLGLRLADLPFYLGVLRAPPFFLVGLGLARMVADRPLGATLAGPIGALALACLVGLQSAARMDMINIVLIGFAIFACGSSRAGGVSRIVAYAAQLSFALFLTHILTAVVWFNVVTPVFQDAAPAVRWAVWGLAIPAAVVFAAIFHHFVDEPVQKLIGVLIRRQGEQSQRRRATVIAAQ